MDTNNELIVRIVECTSRLTQIAEDHTKTISDHEKRIRHIEHTPSRVSDKIINAILTTVISALVAYLIGGIN